MGLIRIRSAPSGPEFEVWEGPLPPPAVGTWAQVLTAGANSGANDPIVDPGRRLIVSRVESNPGEFFQLITPNGQPRATTYLQFVTGVGPDGSGNVDISSGSLLAAGARGALLLDFGEMSLLATNSPLDTNPTKGILRIGAGNDPAEPQGQLLFEANASAGMIQAAINGVLAFAFSAGLPADLTAAVVGQGLKKVVGDVLRYGDFGANYTFGSYAELAAAFAPVAGVITLPTASYVFTGVIDLPVNETISFAPAAAVTFIGRSVGTAGFIRGTSANPIVTVSGGASFVGLNLGVRNLGTGLGLDVTSGTSANLIRCDIRSTSGIACRAAAFVVSIASRYVGLTHCLTNSSEVWSIADNMVGGTTAAVELTGAGVLRILCAEVASGVGGRALLANSTGYVNSYATRWNNANNGAPCIDLVGAGGYRFDQGEVLNAIAAPNAGVRVAANVALQMQGVRFAQVSAGVLYASGTVDQAKIVNCDFSATVAQGINWPAANIPTRGIIEMGNTFNMAAADAFVGHTATDARVMRRANGLAAGVFASETPFVP